VNTIFYAFASMTLILSTPLYAQLEGFKINQSIKDTAQSLGFIRFIDMDIGEHSTVTPFSFCIEDNQLFFVAGTIKTKSRHTFPTDLLIERISASSIKVTFVENATQEDRARVILGLRTAAACSWIDQSTAARHLLLQVQSVDGATSTADLLNSESLRK